MNLEQKTALVDELTEKLKGASAIYLTDFVGLNVKAITQLRARLRKQGFEYMVVKNTLGDRKLGREGYTEGGWVLLDYGDVIVHLFDDKSRDYYGLEDLWSDARRVPLSPELSVRSAE